MNKSKNTATVKKDDEKTAFNEGNQDNTSKLDENAQRRGGPGEKKITNQDEAITNADEQDEISEDSEKNLVTKNPSAEKEKGPSRDDGSPEINTPVYEPDEIEKKVPKMKENLQ